MLAAGKRPTVRSVADALMASGQFLPVSYRAIQRWKQRGWTPAQGKARQPALAETAAKVDAAVPVLTGDPASRTEAVVLDPKAARLRTELEGLSDDALIKRAARESYIAAIILLSKVQENPQLAVEKPREIGSLQQALAGSITAANGGFAALLDITDRMMKTVPPEARQVLEAQEDPLNSALIAFAKAGHEHA